MASKQAVNSFQDGLRQDVDILLSPNKSYRYSIGGRLMFNKNGTYSWEVENGNKLSFLMTPRGGTDTDRYIPLGHTGNSSIRIIFSVSSITGAGEIGIFSVDDNGAGTYKTLFNDQDDPNGDSLNFLPTNQIEARFIYENDSCIRVYWIDGVENDSNQPRVFTFSYNRTIGNTSDIAAYSPSTTSVHAINSQSEVDMGIIKYDRRIGGNVPAGVYQYTYSLGTNDGYYTPWYPLTRRVFVTTDEVSNSNWNEYEMEGSGTVTSKGNRIEIKGIDQKYDKIRVAYLYSQTEDTNDHASIFSQVSISGTSMEFDHVSNQGEPLLIEEIPAIFSGIRAAKTLNIKDSTLYYGSVIEGILNNYDTESILANLTVKPKFRDMRSDTRNYNFDSSGYEGVTEPPVTNAITWTGNTNKVLHSGAGGTEDYNIIGDYTNYKGTQVDHLLSGYFRGETYRFAIVFYDKIGFPSFAVHLCDIRFPDQASLNFTANRVTTADAVVDVAAAGGVLPEAAWPTNNFGDYTSTPVRDGENTSAGDFSHIRIMGLEVSGIDVSSISGSISGFKIVRTELDATIITQGLAYPSVRQDLITRPHPMPFQKWGDYNTGGGQINGATDYLDVLLYGGEMDGALNDTTAGSNTTPLYGVRPNLTTFYSPDYDFDTSRRPIVQSQDRLRLIGGCYTYNPNVGGSGIPSDLTPTTLGGIAFNSFMQKMYYSKNTFHNAPADPFPTYLDETDIGGDWSLGLGDEVDDYEPGLDLHNSVELDNVSFANATTTPHKGWGKGKTLFYKTGDYGAGLQKGAPYYQSIPLVGSAPNLTHNKGEYTGVFICNYTRPNSNPYGGLTLSALERNIFFGTGHFQPIGNSSFSAAPSNIYNDIEVWGGDCFLDYFGFLRTYSRMEGTISSPNLDYNMGVVFPWESKLNHTLRNAPSEQNPMYTDVGSRSWLEYNTPGTSQYPDGIYHFDVDSELIEEFDINPVLLFEELVQFYTPKSINFKDNTRFPVRWRYTREKIYGDPIDSWRIFQVNDFHDLNGEYGEITSSLYIFNQIYSWQRSAFGRLRASDRALIESSNAGTLTTGIGDKLDGIDYVSEKEGNQHQWSLFSSGKAAYWIDVDMKNIMRFAQDGRVNLSDTHGIHDFSSSNLGMFRDMDNPTWNGGISGVYDYDNGDAIWSLNYDEYLYRNGNLFVESIESSSSSELYENNETIFYSYTGIPGPIKGVFFPEGETTSGENYNSVYYVCAHSSSVVFGIYTVASDGTPTKLLDANPDECFKVSRISNSDVWTAVLVDAKEISPEPFSLSYNENMNLFQGFHPFKATFLMSHNDNILSHDYDVQGIDNQIFAHNYPANKNTFYGFEYKAILSSVVAEAPMLHKIFDNIRVNCNSEASSTMTNFLMETETQSYYFDVQSDTRQKYLEDILRFPIRTQIQKDRTRGKHLRMTFEFLNNSFKSARMTNLVTWFRNSNRI